MDEMLFYRWIRIDMDNTNCIHAILLTVLQTPNILYGRHMPDAVHFCPPGKNGATYLPDLLLYG